jgi:hypothetical protein
VGSPLHNTAKMMKIWSMVSLRHVACSAYAPELPDSPLTAIQKKKQAEEDAAAAATSKKKKVTPAQLRAQKGTALSCPAQTCALADHDQISKNSRWAQQ